MTKQPHAILLWAGRIVALLASLLFAVFFIGEGLPAFSALQDIPVELAVFLPMLAVAVLGLILSFFRIRTGAVLLLVGGSAMFAYHLIRGGTADLDTACIFGLPYLFCGVTSLLRRKESRSAAA